MNDHQTSFSHSAFTGWIGVGREDITPPVGIYARNWGAATQDQAEGVHRPLTLTALTLQDSLDADPCVLIAMDGTWWKTHEDEWIVRGGLLDSLSLDPSRVMINLSHTHAASSLSRQDRDRPGGHLIAAYLERIRDSAIRATPQALQSRASATLSWNYGKCTLAHNRGFPDPERKRILCGFNPQAEADDTLVVGKVTGANGKIMATLVNYACHPTTLAWENRLLSPDFVGAMRELVESSTSRAPCLFLQGASGDLAPREQYVGDTRMADAHGRELGYAALGVLEGMLPASIQLEYAGAVESGAPLAAWKRMPQPPSPVLAAVCQDVEFLLKPMPTLEEIETELATCQDRVIAERLRRKREVRRVVGNNQTARIPLWVWRVGDAFLLGQPNESFSWLQAELRRRFASHTIVVMNLVNGGEAGYVPPQHLYGQDRYEVNQTPLDRGSLERLLESAIEAIQALM